MNQPRVSPRSRIFQNSNPDRAPGLDAHSAFQVVQILKTLAARGRTVVISIHAPRSEIWDLFDRVILLSRGATLYSGPAKAAVSYFQAHGHWLPPFVNPAEYLIDLAAIDNRSEEAEQVSVARVLKLKEAWQSQNISEPVSGTETLSIITPPILTRTCDHLQVSFRHQLDVLIRRAIKVTLRDPMGVAGSLFEAVSLSVIAGWIFFQLGSDLAGIRSREGCLYTASSLQGYIVLMYEIYRLTTDIQLFDRERNEKVVGVPAFLVSRRVSRLLLEDLPVPIIFSLIFYFMAGLRLEAAAFFIFLTIMVISQLITVTLATLCVAVSRDFAGASMLGNMAYTVQTFCCGFFVQSQQLPVYLRWLKWLVCESSLVLDARLLIEYRPTTSTRLVLWLQTSSLESMTASLAICMPAHIRTTQQTQHASHTPEDLL